VYAGGDHRVLRVSEDTVKRWCERTYELGFADSYKKFSAKGKTSLPRQQFELAKKGNATMLIWLGKQYLGQTDKPSADDSDEDLNPEEAAKQLCSMIREASAWYRANTVTAHLKV
jgi:hypothetical protein